MSGKILLRPLTIVALGLATACMPLAAQDTTSVAEAAKRAREQKQEAKKPVKVITNDEIPSAPAPAPAPAPTATSGTAAPTTGEGPAPAGTSAAPAEAKKSAAEATQDEARKKAEIESLQKQIRDLQHDMDTQKGAITLDESSYYSDPNRPRNSDLKDKIDREKSDLERMQSNLEDLKAKLEALGGEVPVKPQKPPESITSSTPPQS